MTNLSLLKKKLLWAGILVCLLSVFVVAVLSSARQTSIRKKCMTAMEKLAERESIRLSVNSQGKGDSSTFLLYYGIKDGKSRWYSVLNDRTGKHEIFVMDGTTYNRYDPEDITRGIKTSWNTNTEPSLFEEIPVYREKNRRDSLYPDVLKPLFAWSDDKKQYDVVRQLRDGWYEFQYSEFALDQFRQAQISEARQNYQWLTELATEKEGLENSELLLLSSAAAVRQAEEVRYTYKKERIRLDQSGNIKTIEGATAAEIRTVIPDLETGEINVLEETNLLEGSSVLEIEAVDDPSITELLDEMAVSVKLEKPD